MKKLIHKIKWRKLIKYFIILFVIAIVVLLVRFIIVHKSSKASSSAASYTTQQVETRTIQNTLTGSGTISPLNTYEVTTLVQGEIISADFEEGDQVQKGQVLYQIATDDVDSEIDTAKTKVERAEKDVAKAKDSYAEALDNYSQAKKDYEEGQELYSNASVLSSETGVVKTLFVKAGDTIQKGAQIAEIYNTSYMLLSIPFSSVDVDKTLIGKAAEITIDGSFETLRGTVTQVSSMDEMLSGNRIVRYVTIKVKNPGGITTATSATAVIGDISSADEGTFSVMTDTVITSKVSGEIKSLNINTGSSVKEGDAILSLTQDSVEDGLKTYGNSLDASKNSVDNAKNSLESAKDSLEDAKTNLDKVIDNKTDYSIKAPISGEIVRKDALAGDTITNNSSVLCYIYDLSSVTFSMNVDELDIGEVKVGQAVNITADALEGVEITGKVTNVSLISSSSSGVTQYPVTVQIDDVGKLLPGMNVTGNIVVEESENCLAIPSDALQRGNVVYVKDDSAGESKSSDDSSQKYGQKSGENPDTQTQGGFGSWVARNVPDGFKAVSVTTGLTDGDYIEIKSGLTGTEEVYVARPVSSTASGQKQGLFSGLFGGGSNTSQMPPFGNFEGNRSTFRNNGSNSGGFGGGFSSNGGNFGGGPMQ